jgi:hypothetical protein
MDTKRKGDNARMGYIEFIGNEIEKYEEAVEKEKVSILILIKFISI